MFVNAWIKLTPNNIIHPTRYKCIDYFAEIYRAGDDER
jgi:hypothetical protein